MAKSKSNANKQSGGKWPPRNAGTGRFTGVIDERDAHEFRRANTAFKKEATSSRKKAIEALKDSGYLTKTGRIAQRYK